MSRVLQPAARLSAAAARAACARLEAAHGDVPATVTELKTIWQLLRATAPDDRLAAALEEPPLTAAEAAAEACYDAAFEGVEGVASAEARDAAARGDEQTNEALTHGEVFTWLAVP